MKEKYTKPNINIMKIVIVGGDEDKGENDNDILYFAGGDLGGGNVSGGDNSDL